MKIVAKQTVSRICLFTFRFEPDFFLKFEVSPNRRYQKMLSKQLEFHQRLIRFSIASMKNAFPRQNSLRNNQTHINAKNHMKFVSLCAYTEKRTQGER